MPLFILTYIKKVDARMIKFVISNLLFKSIDLRTYMPVFEIKLLFCAPSGRTGSYNVHPAACPCTPLVYSHNDSQKKRAHTGRTALKNVRLSTEMCAPGAVRTLNFEHCMHMISSNNFDFSWFKFSIPLFVSDLVGPHYFSPPLLLKLPLL